MPDIVVDTYKLNRYAQRIATVNTRISRLDRRLDSLYMKVGLLGLWNLIQADVLTSYSWRLTRCKIYLEQTADDFDAIEKLLLNENPTDFNVTDISWIDFKDKVIITKSHSVLSALGMVSPITGLLYLASGIVYGNTPIGSDISRKASMIFDLAGMEYEVEEEGNSITAWGKRWNTNVENESVYANVNAYLGKVEIVNNSDFAFMETNNEKKYQNGEWIDDAETAYVVAEIGTGMSISMLAVDMEAGAGTDMLGVEVDMEGSAGNVTTEVKGEFSITDGGVNVNVGGEAMVSAVEGKASGTINILGVEITGHVGGYAGALGVEGKIGIEDNKFVMSGGAAALLGVSGGVKIGFNDEGWDNFVDFVTFWD